MTFDPFFWKTGDGDDEKTESLQLPHQAEKIKQQKCDYDTKNEFESKKF